MQMKVYRTLHLQPDQLASMSQRWRSWCKRRGALDKPMAAARQQLLDALPPPSSAQSPLALLARLLGDGPPQEQPRWGAPVGPCAVPGCSEGASRRSDASWESESGGGAPWAGSGGSSGSESAGGTSASSQRSSRAAARPQDVHAWCSRAFSRVRAAAVEPLLPRMSVFSLEDGDAPAAMHGESHACAARACPPQPPAPPRSAACGASQAAAPGGQRSAWEAAAGQRESSTRGAFTCVGGRRARGER